MRGIVVESSGPRRLVVRDVPEAHPGPTEMTVRVEAVSLNQGEVRHAMTRALDGARPGWDFAGTVERAPALGSGPAEGTRVVGYVSGGAWSERVCVVPEHVAVIPPGVSMAVASTLPIAGLTALWSLAEGGLLAGRRVLVTGASGGVGHMAVQLAAASGAHVVAVVRRDSQREHVTRDGATTVIVSEELAEARPDGPFDLVLESVGGVTLANAVKLLTREGVCVSFGNSSKTPTVLDPESYMLGRTRVIGFFLLPLFERQSVREGLDRLLRLVAAGSLRPRIEAEAPWGQINDVAQRFMRREFGGKAVLSLD
jgi:NADPH:quinone reductase-like Zn-dependent oxidoreductase